jgi:DUF1680 family protein
MKQLATVAFISLCLSLKTNSQLTIDVVKRTPTVTTNIHYTSNKSPLQPLHFIKLPVGSIQPEGWVLKYLELQRDGLTGHLGEISSWLDKNNNAWFSGDGTGDHGWEEVPYWLKGYGDLGYILQDKKIIAETKSWLEKVFQSQQQDGYFGPRIIPTKDGNRNSTDRNEIPDLWPNMIMLWCMQSYYEHSNDPRVLSFMSRYFKWQSTVPDDKLLKTYWENSRGGDNLYSIYWLYNRTGEKSLLKLAEKIHKATANWMQHDNLPNWHNVNVAQCFREPAIYYMQTKDSAHLKATYENFFLIRNKYGQVPGGMFGADENARTGYDDPRQAVEACGMVEQMSSNEILTGITGDAMWADNCEDVAFNTYPAAVMPDFRALRYLTAANMVASDKKNHSPGIQNEGPFLMMNPFSSRCCQHNHAQGWPYYAEHLWMATPDNGIAAILYSANTVTAKVGSSKNLHATLKQITNYPFDDKIKIEVSVSKPVIFPLYFRIPGWCRNASLKINGRDINAPAVGDSYIRIEKEWRNGDLVELSLPMELSAKIWDKNKNSASINYGPLTFSLKIAEYYMKGDSKSSAQQDAKWQADVDQSKWPSFEIFPASQWNYGLLLNANKPLDQQFTVKKVRWPDSNFPFAINDAPISIQAKGKLIPNWTVDKYGLCDTLPVSPLVIDTKPENIELIPMGAARLRISAFPVVKE